MTDFYNGLHPEDRDRTFQAIAGAYDPFATVLAVNH